VGLWLSGPCSLQPDEISLVKRQLDAALRDDTRDEGYVSSASHTADPQRTKAAQIIGISIYIPPGSKYEDKLGRRARIYSGSEPKWNNIIQEERRRTHIKKVQEEVNEPEDIAVLGKDKRCPDTEYKLLTFDSLSDWQDPR
jgi:hypothetical protein